MDPKPSDLKMLQSLGKILKSAGYQPQSISAAGQENSAPPLSTQRSGSIAVDECVQAYNEAFRKAVEKGESEYGARLAGANAYRQTMPALSGLHNIADFIACVGHGLVLGAIEGADAARLIYAAQVAHTVNPLSSSFSESRQRHRGRPRESEEPAVTFPTGKPWRWSGDLQPSNPPEPTPENPDPSINQ